MSHNEYTGPIPPEPPRTRPALAGAPTVIRSPESEALAYPIIVLTPPGVSLGTVHRDVAELREIVAGLEARIAALESARQSAVTREVAAVEFQRAETNGR